MRVNGALLGKCVNKRVSLFGNVQMVHQDNRGFDINTFDKHNVSVKLKEPVGNNVMGLVEVHGISEGPSSIACDNYIVFADDMAKTYDAEVDNDAINVAFRMADNPWQ